MRGSPSIRFRSSPPMASSDRSNQPTSSSLASGTAFHIWSNASINSGMPLSCVSRPTNPTIGARRGKPRLFLRCGGPGEKRSTSTPLLLPLPIRCNFSVGAIRSASALSRRLSLLQTTRCAQAAATRSARKEIHRFTPTKVSSRSPRSMYTRTGTPLNNAAKLPSSPALGVLNSAREGRNRRRTAQSRINDTTSCSGAM